MMAEVTNNIITRVSNNVGSSVIDLDYTQSLVILGSEEGDQITEAARLLEYRFYRPNAAEFIIVAAIQGETHELSSPLSIPPSRALLMPCGGLQGTDRLAVVSYLTGQRRQGEVILQSLVRRSANKAQISYLHGGVQSNRWVDLPKTSEETVKVAGNLL